LTAWNANAGERAKRLEAEIRQQGEAALSAMQKDVRHSANDRDAWLERLCALMAPPAPVPTFAGAPGRVRVPRPPEGYAVGAAERCPASNGKTNHVKPDPSGSLQIGFTGAKANP
jgi:hypothetical protein